MTASPISRMAGGESSRTPRRAPAWGTTSKLIQPNSVSSCDRFPVVRVQPAIQLRSRRRRTMNRREFLKSVGVVSAAVSLILSNSPSQAADPQPVTVLVTYHSATGNTEKMAQGVAEGAKAVSGTLVVLKRVGDVTENALVSADAVIVGSPVYFGNMSGEVKTFFDNWSKFGLFRDRKMSNKVGGAFATGASVSSGKEVTMLTIFAAMFINQMIVVSGGGRFGASAYTVTYSPGIAAQELAED